jgi:5-hydroxyisourate hydrolase-like protein (transthyretin family)
MLPLSIVKLSTGGTMPDLTVHVLDDDQEPVSGAKVYLAVEHNMMPNTWLEEYTDDDGEVEFEVPRFTTIDVYVNGDLEIESIAIGDDDDDEDVTVTI